MKHIQTFSQLKESFNEAVSIDTIRLAKEDLGIRESINEAYAGKTFLIFDVVEPEFNNLKNKISDLNKKTVDLKWRKALDQIQREVEKLEFFISKYDRQLGVIETDESVEFLAEMNMMLPNISDVDHTRIVKWMGQNYDYPRQYDIKRKGKDLEIIIKKMSSQEIEDLKYHLESQNYINEGKSLLERISQEAVYIHSITGSGQDGAQNFIDDNGIDAKKLADYVRLHRNSKEKYDVRDIIAGTGIGANKSFVKRFIKQFKESLNEGWFGPFQFNDKMPDEELKKMYNDALSGYANWQRGFEYPKSDYKKAYQEIEKILKKRGIRVDESLNEREYSDEERMDMADKGLALPDGSFPIKDLEDLKNAIQAYGRSKDQSAAAKFIAKRAKELSAEDLIPDTEDFQKSLKETLEEPNAFLSARAKAIKEEAEEFEFNGKTYPVLNRSKKINEASKIDVKDIKVGSILNFNDGEQWKVTKFIGNPSNLRGVFALPHGDTKKNYVSVALEFTIGDLEQKVDSLNEATTSWAKLMKGVKSSETGPWSLVAIDNKKVVGQKIDIRTPDIIPAHYEAMRKEFPKAKIHVEDGTGAVVWTSN